MVAKKDLCVVVLAGGKGTRMISNLPKPLHQVAGSPILAHILKTAQSLNLAQIGVLTGHQAALLQNTVKENLANWGIKTPVTYILQKELTGSGSAAKACLPFMRKFKTALILAGDAPLVQAQTLKNLMRKHKQTKAACTVLSVDIPEPKGYGRIIKDSKNNFLKIVEESAAAGTPLAGIKEINSGMYIFDTAALASALPKLRPQGPKKEYYLTDVLALLKAAGKRVEVFKAPDWREATGINSKAQLAQADATLRARTNAAHMAAGVTLINPGDTYIAPGAQIGADTIIYPGVFISAGTVIGESCIIGPGCWIEDSKLAPGVHLKTGCYLTGANIGPGVIAGPYAHLRPGAILKEKAKIGNFVEIKASVIGPGSKVPHLTYIGNTEMGEKVNVGAGAITCNYDGVNKHKTVIGDNVFVGSNANFVAPVVVGKGAKIGAGSTITQDIAPGGLAIARARQVNLQQKAVKKLKNTKKETKK